jgi:ATP-dependent DNA helicase RecQ
LCNAHDIHSLKEQYEQKTPTIEQIKQTYQAIFNFYQIPVESGEGLSITFNMDDVARNYNLKPVMIYNSIKCLEKEGYFSLLDAGYEPSKVMVKMGKEDLYNFQLKHQKHEPLIKVLLRSYGGLFEQYTHIKEKDLAFRAKISEFELQNQLEYLNTQGVISFIPQTTLPKLIFLQNRINLKFEDIRLVNYPILKQKALARIDSVVYYATEKNTCRNRILLSYFNETEFKDCNYCDVCIEKHKQQQVIHNTIKPQVLSLLNKGALKFEAIIDALSTINSKDLSVVINDLIDDEILSVHTDNTIYINK